jgi:hypothetical protein
VEVVAVVEGVVDGVGEVEGGEREFVRRAVSLGLFFCCRVYAHHINKVIH